MDNYNRLRRDNLHNYFKNLEKSKYEGAIDNNKITIMRADMIGKIFYKEHNDLFNRPFDFRFYEAMKRTCVIFLKNRVLPIKRGDIFIITHSDEISIIIKNLQCYKNKPQKIISIISSSLSIIFLKEIQKLAAICLKEYYKYKNNEVYDCNFKEIFKNLSEEKLLKFFELSNEFMTVFDCRIFNCEKTDLLNYIYWRNCDCYDNGLRYIYPEYKNLSINKINAEILKSSTHIKRMQDNYKYIIINIIYYDQNIEICDKSYNKIIVGDNIKNNNFINMF